MGASATLSPRTRCRISRWFFWIFGLVAGVVLPLVACGGAWQGSIGAVLAKDNQDGRVFVREVPPGLGASEAGLQVGDEIVAIEGTSAREMSAPDIHRALQGEVGTKVRVTVARGGLERTVVIERSPLRAADGGATR